MEKHWLVFHQLQKVTLKTCTDNANGNEIYVENGEILNHKPAKAKKEQIYL